MPFFPKIRRVLIVLHSHVVKRIFQKNDHPTTLDAARNRDKLILSNKDSSSRELKAAGR